MIDNNISRWQEAVAALPDRQFFNTMRLYLGEIKTPYNKQRLTEQLASFIRKPENTQSIITLLDSFDIKMLTAIHLIPLPTQEILTDFFKHTYSITQIYAEIINLTERLLIYKTKDSYSSREFLFINPLLRKELMPYFGINVLFPEQKISVPSIDDEFSITPNFLAAFISFLKIRGIACKSDGMIKKIELKHLEEVFPGRQTVIQLLMNAFINLSLVKEGKHSFVLEAERTKAFCTLGELQQHALLCAASVSRFSREGLRKEAQLLLNCLATVPQSGFSKASIIRLAFIVNSEDETASVVQKSRFSRLLEAARMEGGSDAQNNAELLDRMIDSAIEFGLLQKKGTTTEGEEIYTASHASLNQDATLNQASENTMTKVLNLDSTSTVTILPGLSLSNLLPLTDFMMIKKCGIVTEFEISRQSIAAGFDEGWTPETIFECISNYTDYQIPQNLKINITEWYNSYSSAMLYRGYVLKVRDNNISLVENNPNIKKYIKEKLAEGIYLLNLPLDFDISIFMNASGLDFMGSIKTSSAQSQAVTFPLLRNGSCHELFSAQTNTAPKQTSMQAAANLLKSLQSILASQQMEKQQKESLAHRISSRLILSETQLKNAAIRTEILEAEGMDFSGKVHLIEAAVKDEDLMELQLPSPDGKGGFFTIVGHPLSISRQPGEAVMRFQVEPTKDIENLLVSRITHLRRLRY